MLAHFCYFIRMLRFLFGSAQKTPAACSAGGPINLIDYVKTRVPRICLTAGISRENRVIFHAQALRLAADHL